MENLFFINFVSGSRWMLPVLTRLNQAKNAELRERYSKNWPPALGDLSVSIGAKLAKLPLVAEDVNMQIRALNAELRSRRAEVDECIATTSGLRLRDESLGLRLSCAIESFLYHCQSAYEAMKHFLITFARRILQMRFDENALKAILEKEGISTEWIDALNRDRNLTAHQSSLWCDVRKTNEDPRQYEVLVCEIFDIEDYRPLGLYTNVYTEFARSLEKIRSWLLQRIDEADSRN